MRIVLLASCGALAACSPAASDKPASPAHAETVTTPASPPASPASISARMVAGLDGEGVRLVDRETGSTRLIAFGTSAEAAHQAVAGIRSEPSRQGTNPDCGAGALDYSQWDDLILWFQDGAFVGWASNAPGPSTLNGIGVGMTHVQLEQSGTTIAYEETSLGKTFAAGSISGVVNDDGVVSNLWAGVSCNFD
ncbi:MAG: hypothetical protein EON89_14585 [Brevundimonas sp.]|nr:MAG: hypothetical protein EON89_14585 [Brevundimonas sp.]